MFVIFIIFSKNILNLLNWNKKKIEFRWFGQENMINI